ncbi:MAG: isopenicillin N synthase family dioxygenase [Janthinobacterium lividum]
MSYAQARTIDISTIPVIDMDAPGLPEAMLAAAERSGFFYIRNPAIPQSLIDEVLLLSRRFFAAPLEAKQDARVNAWHRGFIRAGEAKMADGAIPDLKESFIWGLDTTDAPQPVRGIPPNRWPHCLPELRPMLNAYFDACHQVGWQLLRAFAVSIGAPDDTFVRSIDRPISRGSLIYYPPQPPSMGREQFGVSPHTDYGCLTLLYQDAVGGLQVQGHDGEWITAHPIPGTFVVNVGDLLARWTNNRFKSTPHRVVNASGRERYSIALFLDPNEETEITPVLRQGEASPYETVTAAGYIKGRLDAAFAYRRTAHG